MAMVFISHSKAEAEEDQLNDHSVRQRVKERLRRRGWSVKVDEDDLAGGVEWKPTLYFWLADCDAAIVMLHRNSLDSDWLKREADLLLWRRALGARLTIVPVLLKGLTSGDVRHSRLADLVDLQYVAQKSLTPECSDIADLAAELLPDLTASVLSGDDASALRTWSNKIIACLETVSHEDPLRGAARALGALDWAFPTLTEGHRYVAHQFLGHVPPEHVYSALKTVADHLDSDALRRLTGLVLPAWIDPAAVRRLLPDGGPVVATLDSARGTTADQHVRRASCCSRDYWTATVTLAAGEAQEREFMRDCMDAVRDLLHLPDDESPDEYEPLGDDVVFLVIDPHGADLRDVGALVRRLTERLPWLNVIVLAQDMGTTGLGEQPHRVVHLPMDREDEKTMRRTEVALTKLIKEREADGRWLAS
ncbi:toll/interleukin-1 receptor domain-containing protein [Streptomyces sp. NPDC017936]|uniref:toll/interleukin-1 receptor domain-containing protein n=1 Tax=Streptomyces sp. NPDC017936 TaxID=3365016 RepID=UPI0037B3D2CA